VERRLDGKDRSEGWEGGEDRNWVERIEAKVRRVERRPDGKDSSEGWEGGEERKLGGKDRS